MDRYLNVTEARRELLELVEQMKGSDQIVITKRVTLWLEIDHEQIFFRSNRSLRIRQLSCARTRDMSFTTDKHTGTLHINKAFSI